MGTFAARFLVLACILLTIWNKSGLLGLYPTGAQSEFLDINFARSVTDPFLYKM
jgi:hypothetical protein